jgi:hypothetical protein
MRNGRRTRARVTFSNDNTASIVHADGGRSTQCSCRSHGFYVFTKSDRDLSSGRSRHYLCTSTLPITESSWIITMGRGQFRSRRTIPLTYRSFPNQHKKKSTVLRFRWPSPEKSLVPPNGATNFIERMMVKITTKPGNPSVFVLPFSFCPALEFSAHRGFGRLTSRKYTKTQARPGYLICKVPLEIPSDG